MMHKSKLSLLLSTALLASLAAPLAMAQDSRVQQPPAQDEKHVSAQDAQQVPAQTAAPASPAAAPARKGWSDLDADANGSLSVGEAAGLQSLAKVFAQADGDGNGELTQDEYKTWLASNGNEDVPAK